MKPESGEGGAGQSPGGGVGVRTEVVAAVILGVCAIVAAGVGLLNRGTQVTVNVGPSPVASAFASPTAVVTMPGLLPSAAPANRPEVASERETSRVGAEGAKPASGGTESIDESRPLSPTGFPVSISVHFDEREGVDFVAVTVAPRGEKPVVRVFMGPGAIPFRMRSGERYIVQILSVDFEARRVGVRVDRAES